MLHIFYHKENFTECDFKPFDIFIILKKSSWNFLGNSSFSCELQEPFLCVFPCTCAWVSKGFFRRTPRGRLVGWRIWPFGALYSNSPAHGCPTAGCEWSSAPALMFSDLCTLGVKSESHFFSVSHLSLNWCFHTEVLLSLMSPPALCVLLKKVCLKPRLQKYSVFLVL